MMKKLFVLMAVFGLLLTTSCEKEDLISASGNEVTVSFTIPSPDGVLSTRAIGDGTRVNTLYYSVYDAEETLLLDVSGVKTSAFQTDSDGRPIETVDLRLVKGQKYTIVFWAQDAAGPYTITGNDLTSIEVPYSGVANDESRDAFFGKQVIEEVTQDKSYTVTLKRPFAQVNVGVDDDEWDDAVDAGVTVVESAISFTGIPNAFNALTGDASGSEDVTYSLAGIPSEALVIDFNGDGDTVDAVDTLKRLTFAYILAHEGSNTTETTLSFEGVDGEEIEVAVDKMPYQRNYRTNIFGHVLTRNNDFKVIVDSKFDDDHNIKLNEEDVANVDSLNIELDAYDRTEAVVYNVESVSDNDAVVIPDDYPADKLTLNFAQVADDVTISGDYAGTVIVKFPATPQVSGLVVTMPNAHVILQQGDYTTVLSTTSSSTLVVAADVKVEKVMVKAGNVRVYGEIEGIERHEENHDEQTCIFLEEGAVIPDNLDEEEFLVIEDENDWDGESSYAPKFKDNTYYVYNAYELAWIAKYVNNGNNLSGNTIVLESDIDLQELQWTPIGTSSNIFQGTLNGNGKTIKNLQIVETEAKEGKAYIGFFGYAKDANIENVTFENVNLNIPCLDIDHSQGHIGAVAGSLEGTSTIKDVTVKGDIYVESTVTANGASRVAVVAGGNAYGNVTMKNVHVIANKGSYLKANNNVGALAGQLQGVSNFENCSSNIDVTGTKFFAGGIIGLAAGSSTFENCHTTGDITITAGREGKANDHYRVGGIAGGWADGANNVCTLNNCSYSGVVSGKNADGTVAETLDYAGYVGRGYSFGASTIGSTVIIDGVKYVQVSANGYVVIKENGSTAFARNNADVTTALADANINTIYLGTGTFKFDLYSDTSAKTSLTIKGVEGTKIEIANLQARANLFDNLTIENCEILRMPDKGWGHIVFGSSNKANGVYTIKNCTFNGVGTQGIYINETVSGATYNVVNCVFNGDFGSEGAITVQNNTNVDHILNVTGCEFNNVTENNKIYILGNYEGWTLNTDNANDVYWSNSNTNI